MAVDETLMESVRERGAPVLRFYRWAPAALSLGRNQPARGEYDREAIAADGVEIVRRPTGGRAVLHDRELTYSVCTPDRLLGPPRASYAAINRALVAGLRRLGVRVLLQPRSGRRAAAPSLAPCFREPAEGEVVAAGRKLVGSAQYRLDRVMLQHGSLLLHDDQRRVASYLLRPDPAVEEAPAVLADHLDPIPAWQELTAALATGFEEELGCRFEGGADLLPTERERVEALRERYADLAWTWRL